MHYPTSAPLMALMAPTALIALSLTACGPSTSEPPSQPEPPRTYEVPAHPTYTEHIAPMMDLHCTTCHVQGSIAPFPLETYDEVSTLAGFSLASMHAGTMPPWPPGPGCGDFQQPRVMLPEEIETFQLWFDQGRPQGPPVDSTDDGHQETHDELTPDLTLDWGFEYQPRPAPGSLDDYRCFIVDPGLTEDAFVNSIETRPGNPLQVHHLIAYTVPDEAFDDVDALLAEDDRPGYECFGSPRYDGAQMFAGWVPGQVRQPLQEGHGVKIPAGAKVAIQMHYTTLNDPDGSDRTEVDLFFVDRDEHPDPVEMVLLQLAALDLFIDAGDPDSLTTIDSPLIPISMRVHGIAAHMHMLGTSIRADALLPDEEICLIDIPRWDFGWQGIYLYEEPILLQRPFRTRLTCRWDNSPSNQPPGQTPQDVTWGDESSDEMCLIMLIVERPEGL